MRRSSTRIRPSPSCSPPCSSARGSRWAWTPSTSRCTTWATGSRRRRATEELWTTSPDRSRAFWLSVYERFLDGHGSPHGRRPARDAVPRVHGPRELRALRRRGAGARRRCGRPASLLGVVSNFEEWLERLLEQLGVLDVFDVRVISGLEGIEKPDPRIYRLALERAGVEPAEAAFVGDSPEFDIDPPAAIGMFPVLIDRRDRHPDFAGDADPAAHRAARRPGGGMRTYTAEEAEAELPALREQLARIRDVAPDADRREPAHHRRARRRRRRGGRLRLVRGEPAAPRRRHGSGRARTSCCATPRAVSSTSPPSARAGSSSCAGAPTRTGWRFWHEQDSGFLGPAAAVSDRRRSSVVLGEADDPPPGIEAARGRRPARGTRPARTSSWRPAPEADAVYSWRRRAAGSSRRRGRASSACDGSRARRRAWIGLLFPELVRERRRRDERARRVRRRRSPSG